MEQIGFMKNHRRIKISACVNVYKLIISEEGRIKARIFSCWDYTAGKLSHNNPKYHEFQILPFCLTTFNV